MRQLLTPTTTIAATMTETAIPTIIADHPLSQIQHNNRIYYRNYNYHEIGATTKAVTIKTIAAIIITTR